MSRDFSHLGLCILVLASLGSNLAAGQLLAFPEAEGFGRFARGARTNLSSANVYHVTNLNDSGSGSFRDAVSQSNRFVVFDVGGIINIESVVPVSSNITIAGQTAPGGITLYNNRISFTNSHNLISRHFAIRKGAASGREDAASIARGHDMIFDHMSVTWGVDANFDINHDSGHVIDNITIQNTIIGQGLDNVGHSTGGLVQPGVGGSVSIIKSLWADNVTRNPKARFENEFVNNVVYGYETSGYIMGDTVNADSFANVEGNYFIEGPINGSSPFASGTPNFHIYASDNWVDGDRDGVLDGALITNYPGADVVASRHAFPATATMTAGQTVAHVLEHAGPAIVRNAVDTKILEGVASFGTMGGVIERESHLFPNFGSDPVYLNPRARLVDVDNDGIADNWERAHGLNPANGGDWKNLHGSGYTQLEMYVNELGGDGIDVASTGGTWTNASAWSGGVPTLADDATTTGSVSLSGGHGFARRLHVGGALSIGGGTLDVFDTMSVNGSVTTSGEITAGRVLVAEPAQTSSLSVGVGGTLQTGTVASAGGTATLSIDGGTYRATGAMDISVATTLGPAGGTVDTTSFSGQISGALSGAGGLTKRGAGSLTLSGARSYSGPTVIEQGALLVQGGNLNQTSGVELAAGTTLDLSAASGNLTLAAGKSLGGSGTVVGNVVAGSGSVVRPEGTTEVLGHAIPIQAEDLSLGSDWALFDDTLHGTTAGGSYDGSDLNGGGIVLVLNDTTAGSGIPVATGVASTTVSIPVSGTWYLFAKTAEPSVSPVPSDPATQPRGNNSFFASGLAGSLQATPSNFEEVQTQAEQGGAIDAATWNRLSPTLPQLNGVFAPENPGIDYILSTGSITFAIHGREVGTIIDGFVLTDTNLTAAQLEAVLSGNNVLSDDRVLTINGSYNQSAGALLDVEVAAGDVLNMLSVSGTATLAGLLSVSLADGFVPQGSDQFEILEAGSLSGQFENAPAGSRIPTDDRTGSFAIGYDHGQDIVSLSNYAAAVPGDLNFDLIVSADDEIWWEENFGAAADGDSFLAWQSNINNAGPPVTAVPEPALLTAVLMAMVFGASSRGTARTPQAGHHSCLFLEVWR